MRDFDRFDERLVADLRALDAASSVPPERSNEALVAGALQRVATRRRRRRTLASGAGVAVLVFLFVLRPNVEPVVEPIAAAPTPSAAARVLARTDGLADRLARRRQLAEGEARLGRVRRARRATLFPITSVDSLSPDDAADPLEVIDR